MAWSSSKKYWLFTKMGMQEILEYRFGFFSWFFVEILSALVAVYIWLSIYSTNRTIGGYTLSGMVLYYVLSRAIGMVIFADDIGFQVGDEILQGRLINFIVRPVGYMKSRLFRNFGQILISLGYSLPLVIPLLYFYRNEITPNITMVMLLIISLALAALIHFLFMFIVGMMAFYNQNIAGFGFMAWQIDGLFSGRIVPLNVMPDWLEKISVALPFRYSIFIPLQIMTGKISEFEALKSIAFAFTWVIVLYIIYKVIYKNGVKNYDGYGI